MVYIGVFAAVIAVCSWIHVPAAVPFTLQTFAVCCAAGLLGLKRGVLSVAAYILLGLIGLPVFSGFSGGPAALFGPTGGYIIGFVFTALIIGAWTKARPKSGATRTLSMACGVAVCYAFGTAWYMLFNKINGSDISFWAAFSACVLPFIVPDIVKICCASFICGRLGANFKFPL